MRRAVSFVWLSLAAVVIAACSSPPDSPAEASGEADGPRAVSVESIIGGTPATAYPEAAVIDIDRGPTGGYWACSGTLIAPHAALTAGHCVDGHKVWNVYAHNEMRVASSAITYDWAENGAETVNPNHHDLALVFFDSPISLVTYPTIPTQPVADGTQALNIGRILDGTFTSSSYQAPATIRSAFWIGYPYDYTSADVIQSGDSGGAVMVAGTHQLIAVNSGAGSSFQVLARTDLLSSWIKAQIAAHAPPTAVPDAGAPTPKPDAGSPADGGAPPPSGGCVSEKEPNDSAATANATGGSFCGALSSGSDVDWATFVAPVGSTFLSLTTSSDASFALGVYKAGRCGLLATGEKSARVTVAGGPATLCVQIASPGHKAQTYSFAAKARVP
jgi:hypothetical protein